MRRSSVVLTVCLLCLAVLLGGCGKRFATVQEYIDDPGVSERISGDNNPVSDVISFSYHAEDNRLYYDYSYFRVYTDEEREIMKKSHDDLLNDESSAFTSVLSDLRENVSVSDPQLIVTYYDGGGTVITSKTFE